MKRRNSDMHKNIPVGILCDEIWCGPGVRCQCTLPHWSLSISLRGVVDWGHPGGARFLHQPGEVLMIRIHTPQLWVVTGRQDWQVIYAVFDPRPHWLPWLEWSEVVPGYGMLPLAGRPALKTVTRAFHRLVSLSKSSNPDAMDVMYHTLEEILLLCRQEQRHTAARQLDPRIEAATLLGVILPCVVARKAGPRLPEIEIEKSHDNSFTLYSQG